MSFECSHCGFKNNEIQSGEAVQVSGIIDKDSEIIGARHGNRSPGRRAH